MSRATMCVCPYTHPAQLSGAPEATEQESLTSVLKKSSSCFLLSMHISFIFVLKYSFHDFYYILHNICQHKMPVVHISFKNPNCL